MLTKLYQPNCATVSTYVFSIFYYYLLKYLLTDIVISKCWRRLLRLPWTPRRSNQSILKETNPEYSLEGLTLKLKV